MNLLFITFIGSCVLSFLISLLGLRLSSRFDYFKTNIPAIGGIAVAVTFLMNYWVFAQPSAGPDRTVILASMMILVMGIVDDLRELSVRQKLAIQFFAALLVVLAGIRTQVYFLPPAVNVIISLLWIIGITNTINLLDISDGLAGGCSLIVCAGLALVAQFNGGQLLPVFVMTSLMGAVLGFMLFNLPPAKAYLGNSGSHFIGFVIAVISIRISYAGMSNGLALLTPLIVIGFPLLDTFFLIVMRIGKAKLPFQKTKDHIALRLKALGYPAWKILSFMLFICLLFSAGGVALSQVPNFYGFFIIGALAAAVFFLLRKSLSIIVHE